ncbi:BlaI/MecI/CopY family transcriptional regulator [Actinomadura scrupuli]|uniref:BlaI/MecI/CopY family transcriptional regulator n=1 Tax=Actinomadura scrupuli TaxID=559629 RepID=UPI003D984847
MSDGRHDGAGRPRRRPGELESEVLATLWAAKRPLSPAEVLQALGGGLAYTTVVTILTRMVDKGVLTRAKAGRMFTYLPVADASGLAARRMLAQLERENDKAQVLVHFVGALSPADEDLLRAILTTGPSPTGDREPG